MQNIISCELFIMPSKFEWFKVKLAVTVKWERQSGAFGGDVAKSNAQIPHSTQVGCLKWQFKW